MALKPHFSAAKRAGDFIFVSGQLPFDASMKIIEGDVAKQTHGVIKNIEMALAGAGAELSDIVKTMVWLADPADFPDFNTAYAQHFPDEPPARATVGSTLMVEGALVEIEAVAYKPL